MHILYNIGIRLYYCLVLFASLFNKKARLWIKGRKGELKRIKREVNPNDKVIWFHASSLGEFEQGRPVIELIKEKFPIYKILLTFFSPSGYEIRKNYEKADYIYYLPIDSKKNVKKFIQYVNPHIAIFIKYEFWYNYLLQLNKNRIPTYLISANFRKNQIFFRGYGGWFRKMLQLFEHLFVQNKKSEEFLSQIGLNNISISGDTRFDRVKDITRQSENLPIIEKFKQDKPILIAGSSWEKDEELLIQYINNTIHDIKFIIAPHEVKESNINRILQHIVHPVARYTKADMSTVQNAKVLIIDCIGILSIAYKYGNIAYIGGAFGKGLHNILEAATFGIPVLFGPNYKKFNEAIELIERQAAFSIKDYSELASKFDKIITDESYLKKLSKISSKFVEENLGSSVKIIEKLNLN